MSLKSYRVSVPMSMNITVVTTSEEEAKRLALETVPEMDGESYDGWEVHHEGGAMNYAEAVLYLTEGVEPTIADARDEVECFRCTEAKPGDQFDEATLSCLACEKEMADGT